MNSEIYRNIPPTNLQRNAYILIGKNFIMQQINDGKHSDNNKELHQVKIDWQIKSATE